MVTLSSTAYTQTVFAPLQECGAEVRFAKFEAWVATSKAEGDDESPSAVNSTPSRHNPWSTSIGSLAPNPLQLVKPIPVVVHEDEGAFVASFLDANINASRETSLDAFEELRDTIVSRYRLLEKLEPELGEEPRRQLSVLRDFIRAK